MQRFERFNTPHFEFVNYTKLTEMESRTIWEGRNHPEVRKWMTNTEPFSYESHCKFVKSLEDRQDRLFFALKYNNKIIGAYVLNPYNSASKDAESGKFLLPDSRGNGIGKLVTKEFLEYMFEHNILKSVYAKTLISNERNQHINKLMGFKETSRDCKYVYMKLNKEDYHG